MKPPEHNPVHIYRACIRECTYLPLPQCRSHMRKFTEEKFRALIPRRPPGTRLPQYAPEKASHLLKLARKYAALLKHANQGYSVQLEKVLRITYGRTGPDKYELLKKFLYPTGADVHGRPATLLIDEHGTDDNESLQPKKTRRTDRLEDVLREAEGSEDTTEVDTLYPSLSPTISTTTFETFYTAAKSPKPPVEEQPPKWKLDLPPRLQALLVSQTTEQGHFTRVGDSFQVKLKFAPPTQTIWGKPLPFSRYKNQRIKWYNHNMQAALPPLETEEEYQDVHDLVTGKKEMSAFIPRRTPAMVTVEDTVQEYFEEQSDLILDGPKAGPRSKDWQEGRPHEITPRFLQRMLSRVVLSQTPLVKAAAPEIKTEADSGLVFYWDDGLSRERQGRADESAQKVVLPQQADLLFG